jgi:hypothetical protein
MAITITTFDSAVSAALDFYMKGPALQQAIQEKPLLRVLEGSKKSFPGGKEYIQRSVQGAYAAALADFFMGYSQADVVTYVHPDNLLPAKYKWYEIHAGIHFTHTELKQDGITVTDTLAGKSTSEHSGRDEVVLTNLLENKLQDMGESWAVSMNDMLWRNGSQSAKEVPGLTAILSDTPAVGTTGALNRATYAWWRHRALIGANKITASKEDQTLTRKLRSEVRLLRKFGGKPNTIFAGSDFLDALENEVQAKGEYTVEGFKNDGKTDIGMADISMRGVGRFQYDPTMDDLGLSKRAYIFDNSRIVLYPMEGEDKKTHTPARPFDQYVSMRALTWTGGLACWQLNCNGIYEVA